MTVCSPSSTKEVFKTPCQGETKLSRLLKKITNVNAELVEGNTYLHMVVAMQKDTIVKLLLDGGANPNKKNDYGFSPLALAVKLKNFAISKMLIGKGADVNELDERGNSLVHLAIVMGDEEVLKLLLDSGADPKLRDPDEVTPLRMTLWLENARLGLRLIEKGADVNETDDRTGATLLHLAAARGDMITFTKILNHSPQLNVKARTSDGETALHLAADRRRGDRVSVMEQLMFREADINAQCNLGETPLMRLLWCASVEDVEYFADLAANIKLRSYFYGETALHYAAELGKNDVVAALIREGLKVTVTDYYGNTPMHSASVCCQAGTVRMLFNRGAKCDVRNLEDQTPLMFLLSDYRTNRSVRLEDVAWTMRTLLFYSTNEFWSLDGRSISDLEAELWKPVVEHVARLRCLKMFPNENIVAEIKRNQAMKQYYVECLDELRQIANAALDEDMNFFYLLRERISGLRYADDYPLSKDSFEKFPIYGEIMRRLG